MSSQTAFARTLGRPGHPVEVVPEPTAHETRRRVIEAASRFGAVTDAVEAAAAAALGVNRTDLTIIIAVHRAARCTAGEVASAAALSPPATTAAIQRLVSAGLLAREVDPTDRRRAVLTLTLSALETLEKIDRSIGDDGLRHLSTYTEAELEVVERFLLDGVRVQQARANRIRSLRLP